MKTDVLGISLVWFLVIAKKIETILIVSRKLILYWIKVTTDPNIGTDSHNFRPMMSIYGGLQVQRQVRTLRSALGVLPKLFFKLTQSIHVSLQKSWNCD